MNRILKMTSNDLSIECKLEGASLILGEPIQKGQDMSGFILNISEESKQHSRMSYTTDIDSLELILKNMTFRSSSLSNAYLNDPMEKERVGVSKFACSRFITCFCQIDHECVPFWMYYGKKIRKNKVLLQFSNFATNLENCIYTDYAFVKDGKKCFFESKYYENYINFLNIAKVKGITVDEEYDISACINTMQIFDVEYVPIDSPIFSENNAGEATVDFGVITGQGNATVTMQGFNPTVLGKQKSNPWDYEKETRILSSLSIPDFGGWDYLDLRLKPEIFRNLNIVLSPWDEGESFAKVTELVENSSLPQDIKSSIHIMDSGLKGKLNFPE